MKRRAFTGGVRLLILLGLFLAVGSRIATTVWADPSSMNWDVQMQAPAHACPGQATSNDGDGFIETGECPDVVSNFSLQPEGGLGGSQSFFDRANVVWTTGPLGADITGDLKPDPTHGLAANRPATLGATVGRVSLEMQSNLLVAALVQNNIDDVSAAADPHVTGQAPRCGADTNGDTTVDTSTLADTLELWNAITDASNGTVSASETQSPDPTYPPGCGMGVSHAAACAPKGVTKLPITIQALEAAVGLPVGSAVSRAYGIARMPILGGIESNVDVNLIVYKLDSMGISGYLAITLVQYPGLRPPDPSTQGYSPLAQTFQTCPPYQTSVTMYGTTTWPDFNRDGWPDMDTSSFTLELNRLIIGTGGPYDYEMLKSTAADYDGDTIPDYADRCPFDPSSGTAVQDSDGDTLTGLCETLGAGNSEGINLKVGAWNANPPWDPGQDVDGDGYLNYVDDCPVVADRDLNSDTIIDYQRDSDGDTVGDVCEIDLASSQGWPANAYLIPGNGFGYPGKMVGDMYQVVGPGMYVDRDNLCSDPFTIGAAEPQGDVGRWCAGSDRAPTGSNLAVLGRAFADSNDDTMPDLLDYPAGGAIEFKDFSDTDGDGQTDACEAFMGSDPLDPNSKPAGPPPNLDCDSDGTTDASDATPFGALNPDADRDGCARSEEQPGGPAKTPGLTAAGGSSFQDSAWYDFYDVPVPSLKGGPGGTYSRSVTLGDALAVLSYVGTKLNPPSPAYVADVNANGIMDGMEYDRSTSYNPSPPNDAGPPNGAVVLGDALAALAQSGLVCKLGSHF